VGDGARDVRREGQTSQASAVAAWEDKLAEEPDEPWVLTEVQGEPAIGIDKQGEDARIDTSSLTIAMEGADVAFTAPAHSLGDLISLAEQLERESGA
jgi:hypothetical protein